MSQTSTPSDSPVGTPIQPLHNPAQAAQIVVPKAPLNKNVVNNPGMGAKALLEKKMAKAAGNPAFISPTDNLMTPVTQKLNAAKKKQFDRGAKPKALFAQATDAQASASSDDEEMEPEATTSTTAQKPPALVTDDENPF